MRLSGLPAQVIYDQLRAIPPPQTPSFPPPFVPSPFLQNGLGLLRRAMRRTPIRFSGHSTRPSLTAHCWTGGWHGPRRGCILYGTPSNARSSPPLQRMRCPWHALRVRLQPPPPSCPECGPPQGAALICWRMADVGLGGGGDVQLSCGRPAPDPPLGGFWACHPATAPAHSGAVLWRGEGGRGAGVLGMSAAATARAPAPDPPPHQSHREAPAARGTTPLRTLGRAERASGRRPLMSRGVCGARPRHDLPRPALRGNRWWR